MATAAFLLEVLGLAGLILAFLWQIRKSDAILTPPGAEKTRRKHSPPLSIVLLIEDDDLDPDPSVASVLSQDYPDFELLVIDDRAPRGGPGISKRLAEHPRLKRIAGGDPPAGWRRRNHSFSLGFAASSHDWLLFLDDSTVLRDNALRRAMGAVWWQQCDSLSIVPGLTFTGRWERILMPLIAQVALLIHPQRSLENGGPAAAPSYGPFLLVRRSAYEATGGHASIRVKPLDDVALVRAIHRRGYKLRYARGHELAVMQTMSSFPRMWEAWEVSFHGAFSSSLPRALGGALLLLVLFALPWLLLLPALVWLSTAWAGVLIVGAAHVVLSFAYRLLLRENFGIDISLAWLQPLAALTAAAILVASKVSLRRG